MRGFCDCSGEAALHVHCQWCQARLAFLADGVQHEQPVCAEFRMAIEGLDEERFVKLPDGSGWRVRTTPPPQVGDARTLQ